MFKLLKQEIVQENEMFIAFTRMKKEKKSLSRLTFYVIWFNCADQDNNQQPTAEHKKRIFLSSVSIEKFTIYFEILLYMDGIPLSINCKRFHVLN